MFEQFSKSARAAVTTTQNVARATGTRRIDTRHLLVALLNSDPEVREAINRVGANPDQVASKVTDGLRESGLDAGALASVGIDLNEVRARTDAVFGEGALDGASRPKGHLPFTKDAKKALELALRETIRLSARRIDGGHLLLGILRAESTGHHALFGAGIDPRALRRAVEGQDPGEQSA